MSRNKNSCAVHRFVKSGPVWKCAVPNCATFVYFKQEYILLGRHVLCNACNRPFPFDEEAMQEEMPTCTNCRHPEYTELERKIGGMLK